MELTQTFGLDTSGSEGGKSGKRGILREEIVLSQFCKRSSASRQREYLDESSDKNTGLNSDTRLSTSE